MLKFSAKSVRRIFSRLLFLALCLSLAACASPKATRTSPELPPRHWLGESPGVPIRSEKDRELQTTVPLTLYAPDKTYDFEDCVYLAVQQSPLLVKSSIKLEMSRLQEKDAAWKYLPEAHMVVSSTVNLTKYNEDNKSNYGDYGKTVFRLGFYANFPDPLTTYFNNKAQQAMTNIAVLTHRKAIGLAIWEIADNYLQLDAQGRMRKEMERLPGIIRESATYWKALQAGEGGHAIDMELAEQSEKQVVLQQEKATHMENMMRTRLKTLIGLAAEQRLHTDAGDSTLIFLDFDGLKLNWEERWNVGEEYLAQKMTMQLQEYNIMLALAQYMPTFAFEVNNYPPAGQSQPYNGREDTFLHFRMNFTVLDWGRRYRGVQQARMAKALVFQEMAERRTQYANKWEQSRQEWAMGCTNLELAKSGLRSA